MLWWAVLVACEPPPPADGPNLLVVILDDVGPEKLSAYDPAGVPTPTLEALAAEGVRFDRAYADPFCSPTRAGLLTGRHAYHYGIGTYLTTGSAWSLPDDEVTLAEALVGYESAAVGKFHLGGPEDGSPHGSFAVSQGFGHYEGAPDNLMGGELSDGETEDYFHYERLDGDRWSIVDDYATTDVTDAALAAMADLREPWFVHVGYHAAHLPLHVPPGPLNPLGAVEGDPDPLLYDAMVASVDQDIGRLLADVDLADTMVVVVGDNGTPPESKTGLHAGLPGKGTVYEGGVRVPLIVAGGPAGIGVSDALVSHVDLFATLVAIGEVDAEIPAGSEAFDDLVADPSEPGVRDHVYAEVFEPRGPGPHDERYDRMVRDDRYKLIRRLAGPDEFYDLASDPLELSPIAAPFDPEAQAAWDSLQATMAVYEYAAR